LRIVGDLTQLDRTATADLLKRSGKSVKLALMMHWSGLAKAEAETVLAANQGDLRKAVAAASKN
jgi:N-acetylmuramic acid 6-phosphate etherase